MKDKVKATAPADPADPDNAEREHGTGGRQDRGDVLSPLPGELGIPDLAAPRQPSVSKKSLLAIALLMGSLIAVASVSIQRVSASGKKSDAAATPLTKDKPAAASAEPRRLDIAAAAFQGASAADTPRIPAIRPAADELAEPIGVHRTGSGGPASAGLRQILPEDAPVLLVSTRPNTAAGTSTRLASAGDISPDGAASQGPQSDDPTVATSRNLQDYQRRLQGLMDKLTQSAALAPGQSTGHSAFPASSPQLFGTPVATGGTSASNRAGGGLFGGQLQESSTPKATAQMLGNRSLTLPKGTAFTCALKTKVVSSTSGLVGCEVQRNVYGDDGRVVLIERGSHMDGEYRIAAVKPGNVSIPVLWTRIRTPLGVVVDIASPGTGPLGESGVDGYVDSRWPERIGAAMLLSLIDDSVKLAIQNQSNDRQGETIVMPSSTANTSKLAEKVLDSTINIPPLIYQNQGGIVGVYVARDVDFSSVYELQPERLDLHVGATQEDAP